MTSTPWPVLKHYDQDHLAKIALPIGGIGTGTISLGGRGDLRDWEIVNRPAKGFIPRGQLNGGPFFAIHTRRNDSQTDTRMLEGPLEFSEYEGASGSKSSNHGLPRFRNCSFAAAYPFGQVNLSDPDSPVEVRMEAFNPLIPCDADRSGLPVAMLRYVVTNRTSTPIAASVCGTIPNFIGQDGTSGASKENQNRYRSSEGARGLFLMSRGVDKKAPQWGTLALATISDGDVSYRTGWKKIGWGSSMLDFWDDFSADGTLTDRVPEDVDAPAASLAVSADLEPGEARAFTFVIAWHFPNRVTWTPQAKTEECCEGDNCCDDPDLIGNFYTTRFDDSWDVIEQVCPELDHLECETERFVRSFCDSDLPATVKEAALFNLSTLRSQTCFQTPDGLFFGWEGCGDDTGCCLGSCTHVWNYEQSLAFLFGDLSKGMRRVEFGHAMREDGMMSFRVSLPIARAQDIPHAAADGQMGCIMKVYRDWQLSGDHKMLEELIPSIRKALEFCWIPGGWDADQDGVMEGCQHNTMDVEYYGPNPQMGIWYLGALRAAEEMMRYVGEEDFANRCRALFDSGRQWLDENLFNGEYYEHEIRPPLRSEDVAECLRVGMGAADITSPDYQLGPGCLVDQLVGQYMAHVCGLGYLVDPEHVQTTLKSIMKHNLIEGLHGHFNTMRSYAIGDESALLMASYPGQRPENPFPYFTEVMTGFEYTAAIGMLYEGQIDPGLQCIQNIRDRYDGRKRSPFDEAECGHHYARAMAAWAAGLALTGFHYSAVDVSMSFSDTTGTWFWSTGYAWGTSQITETDVSLTVLHGNLMLRRLMIGRATMTGDPLLVLNQGESTRTTFTSP
ncbi:MAG: hypothetical protein HOH43_09425 [Candidatus Latescibacteria bacterium]|nr:hypothetical protein [Candidatus Latescibacterota bacterium]